MKIKSLLKKNISQYILAVNEKKREILVVEVSTNDCHDSYIFKSLLEIIYEDIEQISADGAYSQKKMLSSN